MPVLPSLATSSIGSLPHTQLELALQQALLVDIPAAPQLPRRDPAEYMVAQALDGLPGLHAEPDGTATLDAAEWTRGAATFDARLERTLEKGEGRESFLPKKPSAAPTISRQMSWPVSIPSAASETTKSTPSSSSRSANSIARLANSS